MKGTILIVDDNREIVDSLGKLLAIEGYEILTAYDGMEALGVFEKSQPDLILLDVMMPRLNGLSALMKIRESHNIPAIMLSAKTEAIRSPACCWVRMTTSKSRTIRQNFWRACRRSCGDTRLTAAVTRQRSRSRMRSSTAV